MDLLELPHRVAVREHRGDLGHLAKLQELLGHGAACGGEFGGAAAATASDGGEARSSSVRRVRAAALRAAMEPSMVEAIGVEAAAATAAVAADPPWPQAVPAASSISACDRRPSSVSQTGEQRFRGQSEQGDHACGNLAAAPRVIVPPCTTRPRRAPMARNSRSSTSPTSAPIALEDFFDRRARTSRLRLVTDATASARARSTAPELPSECRVVLILGATGAGKSRRGPRSPRRPARSTTCRHAGITATRRSTTV